MKKMILSLCFLCFGCSLTTQKSDLERKIDIVLQQTAKEWEKKYQIKPIGKTISLKDDHISILGLDFQKKGPLPKETLRKLLTDMTADFIKNFSQNSYFKNQQPLSFKQIDLNLFLIDAKGEQLYYPYIGIAGFCEGMIEYLTLSEYPVPSIKFKEQEKSSYLKNKILKI